MDQIVHIHPGGPSLQSIRHPDRPFIVLRVDCRRKTVPCVIGCFKDFGLRGKWNDTDYGTEDFVAHDLIPSRH